MKAAKRAAKLFKIIIIIIVIIDNKLMLLRGLVVLRVQGWPCFRGLALFSSGAYHVQPPRPPSKMTLKNSYCGGDHWMSKKPENMKPWLQPMARSINRSQGRSPALLLVPHRFFSLHRTRKALHHNHNPILSTKPKVFEHAYMI